VSRVLLVFAIALLAGCGTTITYTQPEEGIISANPVPVPDTVAPDTVGMVSAGPDAVDSPETPDSTTLVSETRDTCIITTGRDTNTSPWLLGLFSILGFLPLSFPLAGLGWTLCGVSVLSGVWLLRKPLRRLYNAVRLPGFLKFFLLGTFFGLVVEGFAVLDGLALPPDERILFHPDPGTDLYLALGFYSAFALIWRFFGGKYRLSARDVFMIAGLGGVFIEQMGAVFLSMNPLAWLYVFLVYGSFQAAAFVIAEEEFGAMDRKEISAWKKILFGGLAQITSFALAGALVLVLMSVAGIPPR